MGMHQQLITEELYEACCKELQTINKISRAAIRLRAIASAKEHGMTIVAKVFNITCNTLRTWVKNYKQDAANLEYIAGRGRKSKLKDYHLQDMASWVAEDCNITLAKILAKLDAEHDLKSSKSAVHRVMHKLLLLSYITPRPQHHKQKKIVREEFKKKSKDNNGK
jgi:transposase